MRISDWSSDVCSSDLEHAAHQREAVWVADDGAGFLAVAVSERGHVGAPALGDLRAVPALHVLREAVDVVLRVPEYDGEHELALRVVLEGEGGELEVPERAAVEEVHDAAAVDRVAGQAVGMPGDDALGVAALDAAEHLVEDRPTRCFRALRFLVRANDLDAGGGAEGTLKLGQIGRAHV